VRGGVGRARADRSFPNDLDSVQRREVDSDWSYSILMREFVADVRGEEHEPYLTFRDGWLRQEVIDAVRKSPERVFSDETGAFDGTGAHGSGTNTREAWRELHAAQEIYGPLFDSSFFSSPPAVLSRPLLPSSGASS